MNRMRSIIGLFIVLTLIICTVKPVFAKDRNVIDDEPIVIQTGQTIDNVVSFGHKTVVNGHVSDAVIVLNGDLNLGRSSKVRGLVLVIGGHVHQATGAHIGAEVYSFSFTNDRYNSFIIAGLLLLAIWTISLALSLFLIILSVVTGLLLRKRLLTFTAPIKLAYGKLLVIGALTSIVLTALVLVLTFTIIGIPLAIILCIIPLVFFFIGLSALSELLGKAIIKTEHSQGWLQKLCGAAILIAGMNIPFIGIFVWLGMLWLSTGLMTMWFYDKLKKRTKTKRVKTKNEPFD